MYFDWPSNAQRVHASLRQCTEERLVPRVQERGADTPLTRDDWRVCAELGWLGLSAQTEYGGGGHGPLVTAGAYEALGNVCPDMGLVFAAGAHLCASVMPIVEFGSDALRGELLRKLCTGELVGANAITEEGAGSDAFALLTSAERRGDEYVLNGTKSFVTNGPMADVVVVYARTSREGGFFGTTALAVDRGMPGVSFGPPMDKLGLRSALAGTVSFVDCRVPVARRIGEEGQGGVIFTRSMMWERTCLFASNLGRMERQLEGVIDRAKRRHQFGKSLSSFQAVSHRIVDMKLRLDSARLLLLRAAWLMEQNRECTLEVSLAKIAVAEAFVASSLDAVGVFGANGFLGGNGVERDLRDAMGISIASGTTDIHREVVARRLGL